MRPTRTGLKGDKHASGALVGSGLLVAEFLVHLRLKCRIVRAAAACFHNCVRSGGERLDDDAYGKDENGNSYKQVSPGGQLFFDVLPRPGHTQHARVTLGSARRTRTGFPVDLADNPVNGCRKIPQRAWRAR